jgi:hypothetical protein
MVKRYPHTAIIHIKTGGILFNGKWVDGVESIIEINGRFDPIDTNNVIRVNSQGNEKIVQGEFYTKHKKMDGAVSLEVAELGIKRDVICWWDFQTHSVISV